MHLLCAPYVLSKHCSKAHYVESPVTSVSQPNTVRAVIGPALEMKKQGPKKPMPQRFRRTRADI